MQSVNAKDIVARYGFLLIISLFQAVLLVYILTPITLYSVLWTLKLFTSANILPLTATIETSKIVFSLVPACIGGSAYYLLLVLNLATPMSLNQRWKSLLFLISSFFVLNVARIIIFVFLFSETLPLAEVLHIATWYLLSIIIVVVLWFLNVFFFRIKRAPFVDDITALLKTAKKSKLRA